MRMMLTMMMMLMIIIITINALLSRFEGKETKADPDYDGYRNRIRSLIVNS